MIKMLDCRTQWENIIMENIIFLHEREIYRDHDFMFMLREHDLLFTVIKPDREKIKLLLRFLSDDLLKDALVMVDNVSSKFKQCYGE